MPLEAEEIYNSLLEWPNRAVGSEDEMMARERLVTHLEGEPGVHVVEEALLVPSSSLPLFTAVVMAQLFAVWAASTMALIALLLASVFWFSYLLFLDGRNSPLVWLMPKKVSANLVAKKGSGRRLFILMAHLDCAPRPFFETDTFSAHKTEIYYGTIGVLSLGVLVSVFAVNEIILPDWFNALVSLLLVSLLAISSFHIWLVRYGPKAKGNLTGVASAVTAASHLWRRLPHDTEVRLLLTTGYGAGTLGTQHYWQQHDEDFKYRDDFVVNVELLGEGKLSYVAKSGPFLSIQYTNILTRTAQAVNGHNEQLEGISPSSVALAHSDAISFHYGGLPTISLCSMPYGAITGDMASDPIEQMALAAQYAETIVRMTPSSSR